MAAPQQDAASIAAITHILVAKTAAKRDLKPWNDKGGAMFFILRGGHFVATVPSESDVANIKRKVAAPTDNVLRMLLSLYDMDMTAFRPPVPAGVFAPPPRRHRTPRVLYQNL